MADYYDHGHSTYEPAYGRDRTVDENSMRRTITRGSHQSHASGAPSATSWVNTNQGQGRRPLPQPRESTTSSTLSGLPLRASRPLPEPQFQQHRVPVHYDDFEDERQRHDVDFIQTASNQGGDFPFGYPSQNPNDEQGIDRIMVAGPSDSPVIIEKLPSNTSGRGFVGGFFKGLKRLPKMLRGGSNTGSAKKQISRKATFGTDGTGTTPTITAAAMTRGNTLPRYLSNPSIGPSNPQFAHRLSMAAANDSVQRDTTPGAFQIRNTTAGPQFPTVTLSPPSDEIGEGEHADYYDDPPSEPEMPVDDVLEHAPSLRERATVMIYSSDSQAPTIAPPIVSAPPVRSTPAVPRVSYATEMPTRANPQAQVQAETIREQPVASTSHAPQPSPLRATSLPPQSPNGILSPPATSAYTISMAPSFYDPSFSNEHLSPVEKFFKSFYHLPWVAHERVTVDYRPGDSARAKSKMKAIGKQPKAMPSWYRAVVSRSRRASRNVDLLSSGGSSSLGNTLSPLGSPTSLSRQSRRSGRSSNHMHHNSRGRPHRTRTRHRIVSNATSDSQRGPPQRHPSPIIPSTYPYAYPAYPYPYPYGGYGPQPHQMQQMQQMQMQQMSVPRGPRAHRRHKSPRYVQGYPSYQPMAMPPPPMSMPMPMSSQGMPMNMSGPQPMVGMGPNGAPIYFITPSPPQSDGGQAQASQQQQAQQQGQSIQPQRAVQISPVIMHLVPGAFNPSPSFGNNAMVSPPLTPQRGNAGAYSA